MNRVLLIGLAPEAVDLSEASIDLATLKERIAVGNAEVADAGYDALSCEIGGGVRAVPAHTELFEAIVNLVHELAPGARFAFNAGPDTTLAALRRAAGDRV